MKLGCHVSNKGKMMLEGAVMEAISYGANSLMVYLGAPQNSFRKPIAEYRIREAHQLAEKNNISFHDVIIHSPYIINLAQGNLDKRRFAVDFVVSEIINSSIIGVKYYVFHPGSYLNLTPEQGLENVAASVKEIIDRTSDTKIDLLVETMAGKGTEYCRNFSEIGSLIKMVDSPRLKVCFDTCHVHDAGYDIVSDYEGVITAFDQQIGLHRLALFHINDSKNDAGTRKDRHENIGYGKIGFPALLRIVDDARFTDRAKLLETPYIKVNDKEFPPYQAEIAMLRQKQFNDFIVDIKKG
ncbi:MAG: deoxyribonuclease IV [Bacilli bacterium]|nr:deoxyribonuclease IV [Bacilli bacterium]